MMRSFLDGGLSSNNESSNPLFQIFFLSIFPRFASRSSKDFAHPLNIMHPPMKSDLLHRRSPNLYPSSIRDSIWLPSFTQTISRAKHLACIAAAIIQAVRSRFHNSTSSSTFARFSLISATLKLRFDLSVGSSVPIFCGNSTPWKPFEQSTSHHLSWRIPASGP